MSSSVRLDDLRQRFEVNPRRYFASLANELRRSGELSQAIALCREHLPSQPGHLSGYIVLGQALYESEQLDDARQVFQEALSHDPENLIALRHLGDIDRRQGDPAAARRWYERVLEADPRNDAIAAQLMAMGSAPPAPAPEPALPPLRELPALVLPDNFEDDPLAFRDLADAAVLTDLPFEEGLAAPDWPDTSELVARRDAPKSSDADPPSSTTSAISTGDMVSAFGREAADPVLVPPSPMAAAMPPELPPTAGGTPEASDARGAEEEAWRHAVQELSPSTRAVREALVEFEGAPLEQADAQMPGDGLPWIAEPVRTTREMEAIVDAISQDARASGERDDVAVFAHPVAETPAGGTPFADIHPDREIPETVPPVAGGGEERAATSGALATETFGELLAAQGFIDRSIAVFEALVRQRPDDVALAARLSELRGHREAVAVTTGRTGRTARERFSALAARRPGRRATPRSTRVVALDAEAQAPESASPVDGGVESAPSAMVSHQSLAALFGAPSPGDDVAARALSGLFARTSMETSGPTTGDTVAWMRALEALPSQVVPEPKAPTPWTSSPLVPEAPSGFDQAFPDPGRTSGGAAPTVDPRTVNDLAEFSEWLKGLGTP